MAKEVVEQGTDMMDMFTFNPVEDIQENESTERVGFNPQPENNDDEYIVHFKLLVGKDKPSTWLHKTSYVLKDKNDNYINYDSPSTFGKYDECVCGKLYWSMMEGEKGNKKPKKGMKKYTDKLSQRKIYACNIQIVNDFKHPENNGKILPYQLPVKLAKAILGKMKPSDAQIKAGKNPMNLMDIFSSKNIELTVSKDKDGRKYEWDFADEKTAMTITDGKGVTRQAKKNKADMTIIHNVMNNLDYDIIKEFGYVEADVETKTKLKKFLVEECNGNADVIYPSIEFTKTSSILDDVKTDSGASITQAVAVETESENAEAIQPAQANGGDVDDILAQMEE